MASVSGRHRLFHTDNNLLCGKGKREFLWCNAITQAMKRNKMKQVGSQCPSITRSRRREEYFIVTKAMSSTEDHLNSLSSYLEKLHNYAKQHSSRFSKERRESISKIDELKSDNGLRSLENYLVKVKGGNSLDQRKDAESLVSFNKDIKALADTSTKKERRIGGEKSLKKYTELTPDNVEGIETTSNEAFDQYLIGVLVSINIAVFLFEIASPIKSSNFELLSLPKVYGAKINSLILTGEWWRLVTPMFLHSGIIHISLGSWALFTFGLEVSKKYGSFTFLLLYALGGISGNLISFLHTPEPSVGGTEPVFAMIGAWLIYEVQNKDETSDDYERLFQSAIITTVCICVLGNFGPVDDWAHFGTAFVGIAYGFATCPIIQVKDATTEAGRQEERITFVRRYSDPCKSLLYFSLSLLLLRCLLLVVEPPLDLIG